MTRIDRETREVKERERAPEPRRTERSGPLRSSLDRSDSRQLGAFHAKLVASRREAFADPTAAGRRVGQREATVGAAPHGATVIGSAPETGRLESIARSDEPREADHPSGLEVAGREEDAERMLVTSSARQADRVDAPVSPVADGGAFSGDRSGAPPPAGPTPRPTAAPQCSRQLEAALAELLQVATLLEAGDGAQEFVLRLGGQLLGGLHLRLSPLGGRRLALRVGSSSGATDPALVQSLVDRLQSHGLEVAGLEVD